MSTATEMRIKTDYRLLRAKHAAASIMQIVGPHIRDGAHQDVYEALLKEMYDADVELVSRDQMAEIDRVRDQLIQKAMFDAPNPFIPVPESAPRT